MNHHGPVMIFVLLITAAVQLVLPAAPCFARRSDGPSGFRELRIEARRLRRFLRDAEARDSEIRFFASRLGALEGALRMRSRAEVADRARSLVERLRDRRLRELFKAFLSAIDGTARITPAEKEAFIRLCVEIENSLAEYKKKKRRLQEIESRLADFIPDRVRRRMLRKARSLADVGREKQRLLRRRASLATALEREEKACRRDPSRGRDTLRKLRGELVVIDKTIEMYRARLAFAETLKEAVADGRLTGRERRLLVDRQAAYDSLRHTVAGLSMGRYGS